MRLQRNIVIPGEPALDYTLRQATLRTIAPAVATSLHSETALGCLRSAGLTDLQISVHPLLLRPPFNESTRAYLENSVLADLRRVAREHIPELDDATWARWERLSNPEGAEYLFAQPDYYCVKFGLLASGVVPSV